MSGFARRSIAVGPRDVNDAIVSSPRSTVPMWLDAPTVSTHGALPGEVMPPYCGLARSAPALVARRGDDSDPGADRALRRERERIDVVATRRLPSRPTS